jgi:hypothetical protein
MEPPHWLPWKQVSNMYCCTMENAYATIKLQVLPNLLTPASTRKKSAPFYFCNSSIGLVQAILHSACAHGRATEEKAQTTEHTHAGRVKHLITLWMPWGKKKKTLDIHPLLQVTIKSVLLRKSDSFGLHIL